MHRPDVKNSWDQYHQIGDALRSDELALTMSPDFGSRLAARLDAEPSHIRSESHDAARTSQPQLEAARMASGLTVSRFSIKRVVLSSIAVATAAAAAALIGLPQLMVATNPFSLATKVATREGVTLRDSRIDGYLMAHQQFSPSVYRSAQYVRSVPLTADSKQ